MLSPGLDEVGNSTPNFDLISSGKYEVNKLDHRFSNTVRERAFVVPGMDEAYYPSCNLLGSSFDSDGLGSFAKAKLQKEIP